MDQPQQGEDSVNNDNQPRAEQPVQINVSVGNMPELDEAPAQQDPVTDGVPGSDTFRPPTPDPSPITVPEPVSTPETVTVATPEPVVVSEPVATTDDLASVASELQSMSEGGAPLDQPSSTQTESAPVASSGTDPMQQIMNEAADGPVSDESDQPSFSQPVNVENPTVTPQLASSPEPVSSTINITPDESATTDSSEISAPVEPAAQSVAMAVANEPMSESNAEAVSMANQAELDKIEPVDQASLINDIIAPSAVAVASVAGSAGENAITGTPESSTVESSQGAELANQLTSKPHRPKSGKGKLVFVVLLITLLFGGGAVAAYMLTSDSSEKPTTSENNTSATGDIAAEEEIADVNTSKTSSPGEKAEAKALDDYKAACSAGGLVSNATAYSGASPHTTVVFEKGIDDKFALSLVNFKDKTWAADPAKVTSGQLVTCISRKAASEVKLKSCPITDSTTKVTTNIDFYSTKYTVDVVEAKTGNKVTSFENSSITTTCPTTASYSKAEPKIFAGYDTITLEASLKDFVTKTL